MGRGTWENTAIASRFTRNHGHGLSVKAQPTTARIGFPLQDTGVIDQKLGDKIIGTVNDKVITVNNLTDIGRTGYCMIFFYRHLGIYSQDFFSGGINFITDTTKMKYADDQIIICPPAPEEHGRNREQIALPSADYRRRN